MAYMASSSECRPRRSRANAAPLSGDLRSDVTLVLVRVLSLGF